MTAGGVSTPAASRALCSDGRRSGVSMAVALVPVALAVVVILITPVEFDGWATFVVLALVWWNVFTVVYVVLTARVFRGSERDEFTSLMMARSVLRGRAFRRLQPWGDGPTFAICAALVAFTVVLVLPRVDAIDSTSGS